MNQNNRKIKLRLWCAITIGILGIFVPWSPAQQMFKPATPNPTKVSAYLIPPLTEGQDIPAGWKKNDKHDHSNCLLAGYVMVGAAGKTITTKSFELPKANYDISICSGGSGKARIVGTNDWVTISGTDNSFRFTRLGSVQDASSVSVEVEGSLRYAGLLAEGDKMPIVPVGDVLKKLETGQPVTIALLGDSVTENAKGMRGGSTNFENGNPGLLKARLQEKFKNEVGYLSHRDPPDWPDDGVSGKTIDVDGVTYRDGRVMLDETKKIRLVNIGKGGATSANGLYRCQASFTETNDWRPDPKSTWKDTYDPKSPPVLRIGLLGYKPDLTIVNFGTNDANGDSAKSGWTANDFLFNIKVLVSLLQKNGQAVILATPHKWTKGTHQSPNTQVEMADEVKKYAKLTGIRIADIYNEYASGTGDSIHPGNSGHAHIVDAYMKALLGIESKPVSPPSIATAAQFVDNKDGTVKDTKTNLVWTKNANLAEKKMTLAEAKTQIEAWNAEKKLGRSDWRLPTMQELLELTDISQRSPALTAGVPFEKVAREYLTDSVGMQLTTGAYMWIVDMAFGQEYHYTKKVEEAVASLWPVAGESKTADVPRQKK